MEDKEAIALLTNILEKYPLQETEREAVRDAIGVLGWTKLVEGMKERKKQKRDRDISDED